MGMNAIEKILASHSEQETVAPGEVVMVNLRRVDEFRTMEPG